MLDSANNFLIKPKKGYLRVTPTSNSIVIEATMVPMGAIAINLSQLDFTSMIDGKGKVYAIPTTSRFYGEDTIYITEATSTLNYMNAIKNFDVQIQNVNDSYAVAVHNAVQSLRVLKQNPDFDYYKTWVDKKDMTTSEYTFDSFTSIVGKSNDIKDVKVGGENKTVTEPGQGLIERRTISLRSDNVLDTFPLWSRELRMTSFDGRYNYGLFHKETKGVAPYERAQRALESLKDAQPKTFYMKVVRKIIKDPLEVTDVRELDDYFVSLCESMSVRLHNSPIRNDSHVLDIARALYDTFLVFPGESHGPRVYGISRDGMMILVGEKRSESFSFRLRKLRNPMNYMARRWMAKKWRIIPRKDTVVSRSMKRQFEAGTVQGGTDVLMAMRKLWY